MSWEELKDYGIISGSGLYFVIVLEVVFVSDFICPICELLYF